MTDSTSTAADSASAVADDAAACSALIDSADILCGSPAAAQAIVEALTPAQVRLRIDELCRIARERLSRCSSDFIGLMGGAEINVMTKGERLLRFALLDTLPTCAEERAAAAVRIQERIAGRRARGLRSETTGAAAHG